MGKRNDLAGGFRCYKIRAYLKFVCGKERYMWMDGQNFLTIVQDRAWLVQVRETNSYTEKFGLRLSEDDTRLLLAEKNRILKQERRVEFGKGILPQIICHFCDSSFLTQDNYVETLVRLQEIFYLYKNEMMDEITDDELLCFMREQFEEVCFGDLDYLEGTCLNIFAQAIRAGYQGHRASGGRGEFGQFDITTRWDRELYLEALRQLND